MKYYYFQFGNIYNGQICQERKYRKSIFDLLNTDIIYSIDPERFIREKYSPA